MSTLSICRSFTGARADSEDSTDRILTGRFIVRRAKWDVAKQTIKIASSELSQRPATSDG